MSLSSITISGTLKDDPEKRFTPTNIAVTNLKLQVCFIPRNFSKDGVLASEIIRVNAWRDLADYCEKLKAGNKVLVTGRALINSYTKNGKKKRVLEVDATSVVLIKDILELKPPAKTISSEDELAPMGAMKASTEEVSTIDDLVTNTEEIPF